METKDQLFKGSPYAVAYYERSIEFFRNHDVTTVGYNYIPDDLLGLWVVSDPQQLLSDMADGKADPDSTLPYAIYSAAYGYHDQIYAAALNDESYKTPTETVIENFLLFQEVLHYVVELHKHNYYFMSFPILHFNALPEMFSLLKDAVRKLGIN